MSGKLKRILYFVFSVVCILTAFAGVILMLFVTNEPPFSTPSIQTVILFLCFIAGYYIAPLHLIVHELGHLLFGLTAGMKFQSIFVHWLGFYRTGRHVRFSLKGFSSGATQMFPKNAAHVKEKVLWFTVGGSVMNLVYGAVFLVLFFTVTQSPALLFFELFAPLNLSEALIALYPAELPAGKTDGKVALEIGRNTADADVMLRVFRAQGILAQGSFSDIPRELLFDAPVVREDNTAFLALLQLRYQYLIWHGDTEQAWQVLERLQNLLDYLPPEAKSEILCDCIYVRAALFHKNVTVKTFGKWKTAAYYRAIASVSEGATRRNAIGQADKIARKLPMKGMREYEKKILSMLSAEEKKEL